MPRRFRLLGRDLGTPSWSFHLLALGMAIAPAFAVDDVLPAQAQNGIAGIIQRHCLDCHDSETNKGGLDLRSLLAANHGAGDAMRDGAAWRKVETRVLSHEMPPRGEAPPTDAERTQLVAWIHALRASAPSDPGRAPPRRINRVEYANSVRDLLGATFDPATVLPVDDACLGYDDIAAVQGISPLLLEKYLLAADAVVDRALVPGRCMLEIAGTAENAASWTRRPQGRGWVETTDVRIPIDDACTIAVMLADLPAGAQTIGLGLDEAPPRVFPFAPASRLDTTVAISATPLSGRHRVSLTWEPAVSATEAGPTLKRLSIAGPPAADPTPGQRRLITDAMKRIQDQHQRARAILQRFATQAFRRPVQADELDRLVAIFDLVAQDGADFAVALRAPLKAVLVSPAFLIRDEPDPPTAMPDQAYRLGGRELASRLSYFLWSSLPDDDLAAAAASGELLRPGRLEGQVRRMLADPRSEAFTSRFPIQWLQLQSLETCLRDPELYPDFDPALRRAMLDEVTCFFAGLLREDRSALELIDADYTYVNERLAAHYGISGVRGPDMRRVQLPDHRRGGVVTMAAVLTITSVTERTSPVKRGKWILEQLLSDPPPPPPPSITPLPDKFHMPKDASLRMLLESHRREPACAACHRRMDPLGFGLDNFDAIGHWRATERNLPIDASGVMPGGQTFTGPTELKALLAGQLRDEFIRTFCAQMLTYALGRGLGEPDQAEVDRISGRARQDGYRMSSLILGIIESYPFQYRRAAHTTGGGS